MLIAYWPLAIIISTYIFILTYGRKSQNAWSFMWGCIFLVFMLSLSEDLMGKDAFIQYCQNHWHQARWYDWLMYAVLIPLSIRYLITHIADDRWVKDQLKVLKVVRKDKA